MSLTIGFAELAPQLREGGLDKACRELETSLQEMGHRVVSCNGPDDLIDLDLVHFHGIWCPQHAKLSLLCKRKGIPTVLSPHGMLEPWSFRAKRWKKLPYFHLIERFHIMRAKAVLATAPQEATRIKDLIPHPSINVLPIGSTFEVGPDYEEARKQISCASDEKVLLYLSRIHPKKGLRELLLTLDQIDGKLLQTIKLFVIGDGPPEYVRTCKQIAADKLDGRMQIIWLPPIWDNTKWPYLQAADLFCLPTFSENFGIVVLEALQVGTPVLTTNETPWHFIQEEGFGKIVSPDIHAYKNAISDFLENHQWTDKARKHLANWVKNRFHWPKLTLDYVQFYEKIKQHS